ncbi:beta-lactamase/transpeptidase-like protein [Aspergillus multicolor]|uniref:beta-lactamase/transpeptidase-like protein n=1 Tax=Aspergillus multicolor TaxID=41759 RepID=UPI003CCD2F9C
MTSNSLQDAIGRVDEIISIAGAPGVSFAIIKNGHTAGTYHKGFRDVKEGLQPDDETRYNINSLTKSFVSSLVGIEVYNHLEGLDWSTPIKTLIPSFVAVTSEIESKCTIVDLLSHRWGASGFDEFWFGCDNTIFLPRSETLTTAGTLKPAQPFRTSFEYNNWGYEIVAQLIEKLTGQNLSSLLEENLFIPLDMQRTSLIYNASDRNEAKAYGVLHDNSPVEIVPPFIGDSLMMKAAGGIKASIIDLLIYYKAFMKAVVAQYNNSADSTVNSPFKHCRTTTSHHAQFIGSSPREQGYGLGWARAELPGQLGRISGNAGLIDQPVAGKGGPSRLVLYHHGLMPGSTSAVLLVPELQSGIIVLQNSLPAIDTADFIAQMLLEALLVVPEPNDYVGLTRITHEKSVSHVDAVHKDLNASRILGTRPKPLGKYEGRYWNTVGTFFIDVVQYANVDNQPRLKMAMNGLPAQAYGLEHYHFDTFSWIMSYDEMVSRGRTTFYPAEYYLIEFQASSTDIDQLLWVADGNFPGTPVILSKEGTRPVLNTPGGWCPDLFYVQWGFAAIALGLLLFVRKVIYPRTLKHRMRIPKG